ncbi:DUF3313 domain-containing protein [Nitrospira sp. BLG_1]|uniref:DUF3313 domain-containing protein n=1 Tax=Nitrospira sp. BLG_1 TaxID=3395883 RepID=UPI0039BC68C2
MVRIQVVLVIAMAGLFSGCVSTEQARNVQLLGFTTDSQAAPQTDHEGGGSQGYRYPTVNWSAYNTVLLQPVTIREGLLSKLRVQERRDLLLLAGSFEDDLHLKLSKDYNMVERPMTGTLLIQVAIRHMEERSTVPAIWARVARELQAVATVYTLAGNPPFTGEVAAEFTICDAQTGELLVAGVDWRVGRQDLFVDGKVFNPWGRVKNRLEFWADLSVYRLCVLRGASDCVEPQIPSVNQIQRRS